MSRFRKFISVFIVLAILFNFIHAPSTLTNAQIDSVFPQSYIVKLQKLKEKFPNWEFVADKIPMTFDEAVSEQDNFFNKVIKTKYNSFKSLRFGCYDWSTDKFISTDDGSWFGASREVIEYYMDPRNFLNEANIFIFLKQNFDSEVHSVENIEKILQGTFLDGTITDKNDTFYGERFASVLYEAGKRADVDPYVLAGILLNFNGKDGSVLSNGIRFKNSKVYNFFGYYATGNSENEVLYNASSYAYSQGWTTPSSSILDGAVRYCDDYLYFGCDTAFYKNFNILDKNSHYFQYCQNVEDAVSSCGYLADIYTRYKDLKLTFRIPVYKSLPSYACNLPAKSNKLNNYYFENIDGYMITPSFSRYTYEYSMVSRGNECAYLKLPYAASYTGPTAFSLKKGNNVIKLTVKSQTGYTRDYILNVNAQINGTLTVVLGDGKRVLRGDTNGDGIVALDDLANVNLHLLKLYTLKGSDFSGADTNFDGKITTTDLGNIRNHLLNINTLN